MSDWLSYVCMCKHVCVLCLQMRCSVCDFSACVRAVDLRVHCHHVVCSTASDSCSPVRTHAHRYESVAPEPGKKTWSDSIILSQDTQVCVSSLCDL